MRVRRGLLLACTGFVMLGAPFSCTSASRPGLPPGSPFAAGVASPSPSLQQGIAAGDITSTSALIWLRTTGSATVEVGWEAESVLEGVKSAASGGARSTTRVATRPASDFTATVPLDGLVPGTPYRYHVEVVEPRIGRGAGPITKRSAVGRFVTAPPADKHQPLTFVWSSDLGGQGHCRSGDGGYAIFDVIRATKPTFALLLGDLIYSDDVCPSPPNAPGSDFVATTLDEFRAKHRYQREDLALQRFLAEVPVFATWDDHEVRNNFAGPRESLMPIGRKALLEYWPIRTRPDDPGRLYRRAHFGADLDVFLLDTRQYRNSNWERDRPGKTMLGRAQRDWLIKGLRESTATWKVLATSVPLAIRKMGAFPIFGNDSWAGGWDGTGFQSELTLIIEAIRSHGVRNVVWLAGDVHFTQVNAYDPDTDGKPDFHEFICGPLSARPVNPNPPEPDLHPTTLYSDGGFMNFGLISVDLQSLTLEIIDREGTVRFKRTFGAL